MIKQLINIFLFNFNVLYKHKFSLSSLSFQFRWYFIVNYLAFDVPLEFDI